MKPSSLALLVLFVAFGSTGCQTNSIESQVAALNANRIMRLYNCYSLYLSQNKFRGPRDEQSFKDFLRQPRYAKNLERMLVTDVDEVFISDRDGEPFKIRYGVNGLGDKAVIFESVGVDGKRMVALQEPREVDDAEYEALWSGSQAPDPNLGSQDGSAPAGVEE